MFDPTAFENMKVVIEGALYDLDIDGEIRIVDRNDWMNTAKLLRKYEISFTNNDDIICTLVLEAGLENLAAELLPAVQTTRLAGSHLLVKFSFNHRDDELIYKKITNILKDIWGPGRTIQQRIVFDPLTKENLVANEATITFNRLVYEDQMDDLVLMVEFMLLSIEKLRSVI